MKLTGKIICIDGPGVFVEVDSPDYLGPILVNDPDGLATLGAIATVCHAAPLGLTLVEAPPTKPPAVATGLAEPDELQRLAERIAALTPAQAAELSRYLEEAL